MDKLNLPRWLAPALVILLIAGVVAVGRVVRQDDPATVAVTCPNPQAGCSARLNGREVGLGVQGELKVLSPFEVWVRAPGAESVQASFTMQGMDMGFNLYTLRPGADGLFRARITLPVCVSGRRDWVMTLTVDGHRMTLPFVTQL